MRSRCGRTCRSRARRWPTRVWTWSCLRIAPTSSSSPAAPTERRFPDGTAIELAAGVPLSPRRGRPLQTVAVGDAELSITRAAAPRRPPLRGRPEVRPGGHQAPRGRPRLCRRRRHRSIRNVVAAARDTRVTLVDRCLQLHAIVPIEAAVASRDASAQQPGRPVSHGACRLLRRTTPSSRRERP